ncbi:MAG: Uma2 family endonuclease [Cyanobacteriota bacterium]|nr:Uma2 family endonuclease [Cyanobacteriota bacterium]
MTATTPKQTQLSLEAFLEQPETKPAREYINGKVYQKPMPQGKHSTLQLELASAINQVGKPQKLAYAFPELRCTFGGRSLVPDIAVFEWKNIPREASGKVADRFNTPPDWTIEILSPKQSPNRVIREIAFCLQQGTKLGWFLDPSDESITVFQPNKTPEFKESSDILPILSILGDWQLTVVEVFSWLSFEL